MLPSTERLAAQLLAGSRLGLSRAITLIESTRVDHQEQANALLSYLGSLRNPAPASASTAAAPACAASMQHGAMVMPPAQTTTLATRSSHARARTPFRVAVSGPPGAGKSTFIEAFGRLVIAAGHRPAVLTIDPTSPISGGSVLGDKTRMVELSRNPRAFVRPSPAGDVLGGVAEHTGDVATLCEAAGYDLILVETVGVGQSEHAAARIVDMFLLLCPPAGGDQLQGMKKGIMELADVIAVTKCDGDLREPAFRVYSDIRQSLTLMHSHRRNWQPQALLCSSKSNDGLGDVWDAVQRFRDAMEASGELEQTRREQLQQRTLDCVRSEVAELVRRRARTGGRVAEFLERGASGALPPRLAARCMLDALLPGLFAQASSA